MDHCGLGFLIQDTVLLQFVAGKQEQEKVKKDVGDWWARWRCKTS